MAKWKGKKLSVEIYGTSHAPEIGVKAEGFPKEEISLTKLTEFMERRKAKKAIYSTPRIEADAPVFLSGLRNGIVTGECLHAVIYNQNTKSSDYNELYAKPRPSHADYAAYLKDGRLDFSGGGEFSGRLTAPYCIAGGIAKELLEKRGVQICAYVRSIGTVTGKNFTNADFSIESLKYEESFPSLSNGDAMLEEIAKARALGDSVGGVVDCVVRGAPKGVGGALFDGLEGKLANLIYAIPAVKGVSFGEGFTLSKMFGSEANDPLCVDEQGDIRLKTNRAGGINGGITNGEAITLSVAFRPTPSISKPQKTVNLTTGKEEEISIKGRHDACIVPRALPVVESAVALGLLDEILDKE
ncbi:MAG: chorismate synthase [Clostridiales bacterium]|nr:chorismate synthase [Clostridiales bacterium]